MGRTGAGCYCVSLMRRSPPRPRPTRFLPTTAAEIRARGWDAPDVVLVSGRRVHRPPVVRGRDPGPLARGERLPRSRSSRSPTGRASSPWRALGRPRLFYGVSAGNMDSLDQPLHGEQEAPQRRRLLAGRPDRPAPRPRRPRSTRSACREAFPGVPVIAGGVEASLRRIAHYDYWSDKVRPSILVTSQGAPARCTAWARRRSSRSRAGSTQGGGVERLRDLRGVAYLLGKSESVPAHRWDDASCAERGRGAAELRGRWSPTRPPFARDDPRPAPRDQPAERAPAHRRRTATGRWW